VISSGIGKGKVVLHSVLKELQEFTFKQFRETKFHLMNRYLSYAELFTLCVARILY